MKFLNSLLMTLKMTCKDVSPLISEMMDHSLPFHKRWRVKLHLAICILCRHYQGHLETLRKIGQYLGQEDVRVHENHLLGRERKENIKSILRNQR